MGKSISLSEFEGNENTIVNVWLLNAVLNKNINTAFTGFWWNNLQRRTRFVIGLPCNQFGKQEPWGKASQNSEFLWAEFLGVTFLLTRKDKT